LSVTHLSDGTILDANERFEALTGYTRNELLGARTTDLGLWVDPDQRGRLVERLRAEGAAEGEFVIRRKDGARRVVLIAFRHVAMHDAPGILSNILDVTEQRAAIEALRESEEKLRLLAETVDD